MISNASRRNLITGAVATGALCAASAGAKEPTTPLPVVRARADRISEQAFVELCRRVNNWGRWGQDDQRGALNLITPAIIRRASQMVRSGEMVACGGGIPALLPNSKDTTARLRLSIDAANGWSAVNDHLEIDLHGRAGLTHLDALAHIRYRGLQYNGRPASGIETNRITVDPIETASGGIAGRGVLIDLAKLAGKPWLEAEDRIMPDALARHLAQTRTQLRAGDLLFLSTGLEKLRQNAGSMDVSTGGLAVECVEMIHAAGPALIISDGGTDTGPSEVQNVIIPWHVLCINQMGVRLVDGAKLDGLVDACERHRRYDFFCTIAPIAYWGATASPVNPLCFF